MGDGTGDGYRDGYHDGYRLGQIAAAEWFSQNLRRAAYMSNEQLTIELNAYVKQWIDEHVHQHEPAESVV